MKHALRLSNFLLPVLSLGLLLPFLRAQEAQPSLLDRSPFIPPDFNPGAAGQAPAAAGPSAPGSFELRGVYRLGDEYRFLVSSAQRSEGNWVELGKSYDDFEVRRYDANSETLTLFYNNQETRITLANVDANPTPMPIQGQAQPAAAQAPRPAAPRITRRAIRPTTSGTGSNGGSPPAWLEKLREEAAARRAQAAQSRFDNKEAQEAAGQEPDPERTDIPLSPEDLQELQNSAPTIGPND